MALRIEKAFGVSMDTLLRMQAWWEPCMREKADTITVKRYTPTRVNAAAAMPPACDGLVAATGE